MLKKVAIFLCLIAIAYPKCAMVRNAGDARPMNASGNWSEPQPYGAQWTGPAACPEFKDGLSCCSDFLNDLTYTNFQLLQTAFGASGGGCDICAANIMRFFCYYSCSPDQDKFMNYTGDTYMQVWDDTTNGNVNTSVSLMDLNFTAELGCSIYNSCSKITFLTEISAGNSALGFITFLFDRGIPTSFTKVNAKIPDDGSGMKFATPAHMCNDSVHANQTDQYGYPMTNPCPCNFCLDSCLPLPLAAWGSITDGFNSTNVILAYLFAILLTILVILIRRFRRNKKTILTENENMERNILQNGSLQATKLD